MKSAWRQTDRCCNIQSAITIKIGERPKNGRVAYAIPLVRTQAAVRINNKDGDVIRRVVKHGEIRRSIAVHVTRFQVVADPESFQNTRTGLRSYRLKGSVTITQSRGNQLRAEGGLQLHYHPEIEQTVPVKVGHLKFEGRSGTDDRGSKRKVSVARKYTHTVWQGSYDVDVAITRYLRQSQAVRQSTGKIDIGHPDEVLISVIPENKDASVDARAGFLFGQHNVEVAVAIEVGSLDGPITAGENFCHNGRGECSVAEIQRRTKMIWRIVRVGRKDQIDKTVAVDIPQLHVGEISRR